MRTKHLVLGILEKQMLCHMAGNESSTAGDEDILRLVTHLPEPEPPNVQRNGV